MAKDFRGKDELLGLEIECERLRFRLAELESILNSIPELYFVIDPDNVIVDFSAPQDTETYLPQEDFLNKSFTGLLPPELEKRAVEVIARVRKTGQVEQLTYTLPLSGRLHHFLAKVSITVDDQIIWLASDITESIEAQKSLSEISQKINIHIDQTPLGFIEWDLDFRTTQWNPAAEKIFGFTREEAIGRESAEMIIPKSALEEISAVWNSLLGQTGGVKSINENLTKSGDIILCEWHNTPLRNENGEVVGVASFVQDITERRNSERALAESERRYREIFNSTNDALFIHDAETGIVIDVNQTAIDMYQAPKDVMISHEIDNFCSGIAPYTAAEATKKIALAIEEGPQVFEWLAKNYHGETFWVEVSLRLTEIGGKKRVLAAVRDINRRKVAEERLKDKETILGQILDRAQIGIFRTNPEGNFLMANPAVIERLGYESIERINEVGTGKLYEDEGDRIRLMELLKKGPVEGFETTILSASAEKIHVSINTYPVFNDDGDFLYFEGNILDITERKEAEEERLELERQILHAQKLESLGILAGGIAHDFNNILMGVLGNTELALLNIPPESPARERIKKAEEAATRAADLAKQMLAYSGKGHLSVEPINLNKIVDEMTHLLETAISKKAAFIFERGEELPIVEGDPTQIRQIFMNLVTNAAEAIGDADGVITIATGVDHFTRRDIAKGSNSEELPEGDYAYIKVGDTGHGMDEETKEKIFDPFFTTKFTGRGLGLAAVLGITRSHHGSIILESEEGRGSTFTVIFPCASKAASSQEEGEESHLARWRGQGTIMVVDDEEMVLDVAKTCLEEFGYRVIPAINGEVALDIYRKEGARIDIVVLDMTMPKMSGGEVFEELKKMDSSVNVILSSGYNEVEIADRLRGSNFSGFIQKPYRPTVLISKIREIIDSNR